VVSVLVQVSFFSLPVTIKVLQVPLSATLFEIFVKFSAPGFQEVEALQFSRQWSH